MDVYSKEEALKSKRKILDRIEKGEVFIYPTDTIYGIGCDATNAAAVQKVRELKERPKKPFSVIAPSVEWITKNCQLSPKAKSWLLKLPGPFTLVLPLNAAAVCAETNKGLNSLGVRIPNHWVASFAHALGKPILTTSVNRQGLPPCTRLDQFKKFGADFVIYEGDKAGTPSKVVDLTGPERIVRE